MKIALILCTALFIALKVHGNIDWSWWIVFTPAMILGALTVLGLTIAALVARTAVKQVKSVHADFMKGGSLF
jgi:hypothetical protein